MKYLKGTLQAVLIAVCFSSWIGLFSATLSYSHSENIYWAYDMFLRMFGSAYILTQPLFLLIILAGKSGE